VNDAEMEIMIVAGEPSGDELGARLVEEFQKIEPNSKFFGATGPKMRAAGVESIAESDSWPVTGIAGVMSSAPKFLGRMRWLESVAQERLPAVVILIDFPEFNLKLAKRLHSQGQIVVYYVSPQLWAWRKYRVQTIRKHVDLLLSILPFEKSWYRDRGVDIVKYVGNPIAESVSPSMSKKDFFERHRLDQAKPLVALLPGSRKKEIRFNLPIMLDAAELMHKKDPTIQFVLAAASEQNDGLVSEISDRSGLATNGNLLMVQKETINALNAADVAAISSGTATLEAGIIGTPMAIVYKMSKLDAMILGPMISVDNVGLINLIAGKRIMKEFVQDAFTAKALSNELFHLLEHDANRSARDELKRATANLKIGASKKAAELGLDLIRNSSKG